MAEEIINIVTLTVDKTEVNKSIVDTKQQIFELQKANTELRKDITKNGDVTGEQTKKFVENEQTLKKLNAQYKAQSSAINDLTLAELKENKALTDTAKSRGQAIAQSKELKVIRDQVNDSTEEGAQALALLNAKINQNDTYLKNNASAQEKAATITGDYRQNLSTLDGTLGKIGGRFGETARTVIGFGRNVSEVSDTIAKNTIGFAQNIRTQIGFTSTTVAATEATEVQTVATNAQTTATEAGTVATATASAGLKLLRLAIIGTGIGALVVGILAVKEALTSSQAGQERYAKFMAIIGSITGNLSDVLSNIGNKIIAVFENPKQALKDFGNLIKDNIVNRFVGLAELIPNIGKAISFLLAGEFRKAGVVMVNSVAKITTGVDDIVGKAGKAADALGRIAKDAQADAKAAAKISDMRAKADRLEIQLINEKSEADAKSAILREKSRDADQYSAAQRLKFAKQAADAAGVVDAKEKEVLALRYQAIKLENTLSNTTKEAARAEQEALAALSEWKRQDADDTRAEIKEQRKIQAEIEGENRAALKARQDASKALLEQIKTTIGEEVEVNKKAFEEKKKLSEQAKDDELANAEFLKTVQIKRIEESKLLEADKALALIEIQKGYVTEVDIINKNFAATQKAEAEIAKQEAQTLATVEAELRILALEEQGVAELEVQRLILETQLEQKKAALDLEYVNEKRTAEEVRKLKELEDKKYAVATKKINDQVAAAKRATNLGMVKDSIAAAAAIFGENKAVAVAMALVNTYEGIAAGVKLGYPAAIPAVAAAAATGFLAVKNILKTDKSGGGGGSASGGGGSTATPAAVFSNPARTQTVATVDAAPNIDPNVVQVPVLVLSDVNELNKQNAIKIKST